MGRHNCQHGRLEGVRVVRNIGQHGRLEWMRWVQHTVSTAGWKAV